MGDNMKKMDVVWDTGSEWLIVNSSDCFTCTTPGYDTSSSSVFKILPGTYGERAYGTAYTLGDQAIDSVCITSLATSCIKTFKWFLVNNQMGNDGIDGILGLAFGQAYGAGPLLIPNMYFQGIIS